ncbi:MAG: tRNA 2-thiouridine(34) synthase MnmA [Nanoarchaeota archaeon]
MKQRVMLGLSGGVDSAVTAWLLKKQGYEVICAFLKCFSDSKIKGQCSYLEDKKEAQKIASKLNLPLIELDYEKEYKNKVIKPMFKSYSKGITPNPDSLCNKTIKFPYLWKEATKNKCNFIATGHYITKLKNKNVYTLKIPKDKNKDQSYFLYQLTQKDLSRTLFPIGDYTKSEVRRIARINNFQNWNKHGTRGLCFVGNIDMKSFLKQKIKNKQGIIRNPEGEIVGKHNGIMFYTIGERLRENEDMEIDKDYRNKIKSKLYIAKKDIKKNELIVAPKNNPLLKIKEFRIKNINWISGKPKSENILVRIRHLGKLHKASMKGNKIHLNQPIEGIALGQSAVFYSKSRIMLGGGEISD